MRSRAATIKRKDFRGEPLLAIGRAPRRVGQLLDDLERRAFAVPGCGARQQCADCLNRLSVPSNDAADIRLPHRQAKNGCLSQRRFGKHHLVRKVHELTNDKLEKLFHEVWSLDRSGCRSCGSR